MNILGVIATTCTGGCGYWGVSYHFKENAYKLLNSLKKMNIKNINSLKVSQELDLGGIDPGPYFSINEMYNNKELDIYRKTEFGKNMSKNSQSTMNCTLNF